MSDQPDHSTQARQHARRAADLYRKRDAMGALKALGQAFDLDPKLKDNEAARQLASRLTGLDDEQAVETLADFERRSAFIRKHGRPTRATGGISTRVWIAAGSAVLLMVVVAGVFVLSNAVIPRTLDVFGLARGQVERYALERQPNHEYYVSAPLGSPPEMGWPTLVAVHGAGQTGADMVEAFRDATQSNGILLIAPTFPDMPDGEANLQFYDDARSTILLILDEMQVRGLQQPAVFMHYLGQVYFGYGEGARVVTELARQGLDYPDAGYTVNLPLAVALANGGPALAQPTYPVHFLIAVGENDPGASTSISYAERLRTQGYDVDLQIIPGAGRELTRQQVELTVELVREVYSGEDSR